MPSGYENLIRDLQRGLNNPLPGSRKLAVEQAIEMLRSPDLRGPVRELLEKSARRERDPEVKQALQAALKLAAQQSPSAPGDDDSPNIRAVCPFCLTANYYNRRKLCTEYSEVIQDVSNSSSSKLRKMLVPCDQAGCNHKIEIEINCEDC